jgi:type IV pilus assembly protein PilW
MLLNKQRGVSLVEMMVAITIGLILLAGVLSIFFSSKVTYFSNEKMARLQENGRVALNLISHDVRAAGYMGCARSVPFTSALNSPTSQMWNYSIPLMGFESDGAGAYTPALSLPITLNPAPVANSDIILARTLRRDARLVRVEGNLAALTSPILVTNTTPAPVTAGQHVIITDCNASTVFQVRGYTAGSITHTSGGSNPGNATGNVSYPYRVGARLAPVQTVLYYVGNNAAGEPGLYRQTGVAATADLLIEGVEALQIAYGRDTNGDRIADQYVSASGVTNWDSVISVNYSLLIRSDEVGTDVDNKTYQLLTAGVGGITVAAAGDRRSRLMFTTTIALRNRAL